MLSHGFEGHNSLSNRKACLFPGPPGDGKRVGWVDVYIYRRRFLFEILKWCKGVCNKGAKEVTVFG